MFCKVVSNCDYIFTTIQSSFGTVVEITWDVGQQGPQPGENPSAQWPWRAIE